MVVASAKSDAEQAGSVVGQAPAAMSSIERSFAQVSPNIGKVGETALRPNILALNTGVEAARAGDAGHGFAVVASEVRMLAQHSAKAAKAIKEIRALTSDSGQQARTGVDLVHESGQALGRIVTKVSDIDAIVSQIAHGTQEQAMALHEANAAIRQMDEVTQ